jgi:hypothetical protein
MLDLDTILKVSGLAGGIVALVTFWRNAKLKRAEWLYQLHAKFYESPAYKRIRHMLDYQPPAFANLRAAVTTGGHDELAEAFVDYLNFFEFVASLWKMGQLREGEISMIFEYYLLNLKEHEFVMEFIRRNGFENLEALITRVSAARDKG